MSNPQVAISISFHRQWNIRLPYVYRYLEKEYVDNFFEKGIIRLSSFENFSKHSDEHRLDSEEGRGVFINATREPKPQTVIAGISYGRNAYVLCGSTIYKNEMSRDFRTNSGFRINDTTGFAEAISRYLPGCVGGIEGLCTYLDKRTSYRTTRALDIQNRDGHGIDIQKTMGEIFQRAGDDFLFMKHSSYSSQNEYRIIWAVPNNVSGYIDVVCLEAVKFCTRFEDMHSESESKKE
ncbi:hypothetical protein [Nitrosomonas sp. Nm33]|uniref:hypothetical protein n=1 Tax=Nitrosomonas sp. Nm33 TaxID=133724 RepID=UPI00089D722E|nr:hypothetical protein [Nitrosomonas sp. Nm33]SDY65347.1 hypothetical protein SAMN05421755_103625 [Nitrosomonas sp. Nm33]